MFAQNFNPHTPPRGVTRLSYRCSLRCSHFNPHTPPRGVTDRWQEKPVVMDNFNPHTPPRGVTPVTAIITPFLRFQSTHPSTGCDNYDSDSRKRHPLFQSTHPSTGCDFRHCGYLHHFLYFNPHTPPRGGRVDRGICSLCPSQKSGHAAFPHPALYETNRSTIIARRYSRRFLE